MTTHALRTPADCPSARLTAAEREMDNLRAHEANLLACTSADDREAVAWQVRRSRRIVAALISER